MSRWRVFFARLGEFFRKGRIDRELSEELQTHLDYLTEEYVRRGMTREAARTAARRDFGGVDRTREAVRDRRGFRPVETLVQDIRYAVRLLRASPGFTAAAIVTLALGIGANTAIFSLVDAAMLRPLPYPNPDRLLSIWEVTGPAAGPGTSANRTAVAPANYVDYRRAKSVSGSAAFAVTGKALSGRGDPERLFGEEVTAGYFEVLGVTPALGRPVQSADNEEGHQRVVLLSHGLWQERFGESQDVIGQLITLDDQRYEVIGVMPAGFVPVSQFGTAEPLVFWIPSVFSSELLANRHDHEVQVVARLAPGASPETVRDELRGMASTFNTSQARVQLDVDLALLSVEVSRNVKSLLLLLLGAVGLVLLMACVNVASLLVVRSLARRREIAVRFALGATKWRVARELVTQSLVLAALGAIAGWGLAIILKDVLVSLTPATVPRLHDVALDGRVLGFTAALAASTGLAFGLLPAWQLSLTPPAEALGATQRVVSGSWAERGRAALIVAEAALSILLLIGAGLMIRSLATLNRVDLGFDPSNILSANLALPERRYPNPEARLAFFEQLASSVAALPGVRSVSFANRLPLRGIWSSGLIVEPVDGPLPAKSNTSAGFQAVSPSYFSMFGLRPLRGRLLEDADREGRPPVAVVNEEFRRALLDGADAIGRRFRRFQKAPSVTIVGVVPDIRREGRTVPVAPQVYLPAAQTSLYPLWLSELAVQADGQPQALAPQLRAAVWAIDRDQPIARVLTLDEVLALRQAERHFQTLLFTLFAGLALALAVVGIYGVVSYSVSQRTAEIGLRMALGADGSGIVRWIVGQSLKLVGVGAVVGLVGAAWLTRSIRALLFQISPTDPAAYAGAIGILAISASSACYIGARRAIGIDPATALK